VGVLEYAPGQLTTSNSELEGKTVKLYYPPEAVSDEKFLRSLQSAPVVVGGHDTTTNEHNKKIDGWAHTVNYDTTMKAAMISGIVKGNKEVAYIKGNLGQRDFGASAFVDIYNMKIESGVTPDGQEYNAIATELRATHVALAQHVRDPENKIKVTNAVVVNTGGNYNSEEKNVEMTAENIAAIVENAVKKAVTAKNESDRLDKLESMVAQLTNAVQAKNEEDEKKKEDEKKEDMKAENEDEEKKDEKEEKKEDATLENAKPAQSLVAAVGNSLNIDFGSKTPSFATLASLLGIKETAPAERIAAVNAKVKFVEQTSKKPEAPASSVEVF
jgi:archaellum component FlaD/FlaE